MLPYMFCSETMGSGSNLGRVAKVKEAGAWQRTIGLGCKAGARPRTRGVLDKTKRAVGSMVKLEHVQKKNRPLTSRYGMNVPIL